MAAAATMAVRSSPETPLRRAMTMAVMAALCIHYTSSQHAAKQECGWLVFLQRALERSCTLAQSTSQAQAQEPSGGPSTGRHIPFWAPCLKAASKSRDMVMCRQDSRCSMWLSAAHYLLRRGSRDNRRCRQGDYGPGAGRGGQGGRPGKARQRVLRVRLDLIVCQRSQVCPLKALLHCSAHSFSCLRNLPPTLIGATLPSTPDMHKQSGD